MTPELLEAMETVRRYDAGDGAVGSHDHERVSAAFRLLARYLVEHAGELVRVKTCALNLFDEWQTTPMGCPTKVKKWDDFLAAARAAVVAEKGQP